LAPVGFDRGPWVGQFAADLDPGGPACFHPASSAGLAAADFGPVCLASQACSVALTADPGEPACSHPVSSAGLAAADFGPACLASQACSDVRTDDPA